MSAKKAIVRWLGQQDYLACWQAMRQFTDQRDVSTTDEFWLLEHFPVYTQGQNGQPQHILQPGTIPIIQTDRGGQVTYHGPGQLMIYTLVDIQRLKITVRDLVCCLEKSLIDFLSSQEITAVNKAKAPGVYIAGKKIGSVGLRIRRGCAYHGLAFNIAMDMQPFAGINPCGFADLQMTQLADFGYKQDIPKTGQQIMTYLLAHLGYTSVNL